MCEEGGAAGSGSRQSMCEGRQRAAGSGQRQQTFGTQHHRAVKRHERGGNACHSEGERPRVRQGAKHDDILGE